MDRMLQENYVFLSILIKNTSINLIIIIWVVPVFDKGVGQLQYRQACSFSAFKRQPRPIFHCQKGSYCRQTVWHFRVNFLTRLTWIWAVHDLHHGGRQTAGTRASGQMKHEPLIVPQIYPSHPLLSQSSFTFTSKLLIALHRINDLWNLIWSLSGKHKGIPKWGGGGKMCAVVNQCATDTNASKILNSDVRANSCTYVKLSRRGMGAKRHRHIHQNKSAKCLCVHVCAGLWTMAYSSPLCSSLHTYS